MWYSLKMYPPISVMLMWFFVCVCLCMMVVFLHIREQFCDPLPLDVWVEISRMCQSMSENMQWPRCHTLPVSTSVRSCMCLYYNNICQFYKRCLLRHCHVLLKNLIKNIEENQDYETVVLNQGGRSPLGTSSSRGPQGD